MKVSVVMPCHNNATHIGAALRSIAQQQLPAYEVIVVDDASTDHSLEVVEQSGVATHILHTQARNAAAARNAGIEAATGDFVAFLDADNLWLPEHLALAGQMLQDTDHCLFVAPPAVDGDPMPQSPPTPRKDAPITSPQGGLTRETFIRWRIERSWGFPTSGIVARRDRLQAVGGFNVTQKRRHDFELVMRLIDGQTWCATPLVTWWSRPPRAGNISADKSACAYYALRALTLNQASYDSGEYRELMRRSAVNAVKNAVFARDRQLIGEAKSLAAPYLSASSKAKLMLFTLTPPVWRKHLLRHA